MKPQDEQVLIEELWQNILDMIEGSTISLDELEAILNAVLGRVRDMAGTTAPTTNDGARASTRKS